MPKVLKGANNPNEIANAIASNKGGMGVRLPELTPAELADIVAYIGTPNLGWREVRAAPRGGRPPMKKYRPVPRLTGVRVSTTVS